MMPTHDQSHQNQPSSYAAFAPNVNAAAPGAGGVAGNGAPNALSAAPGVVGGVAAPGSAVGVSVGAGAGNAAGPRVGGAAGAAAPGNSSQAAPQGASQQMLLPSGVVMQPLPGLYPSDGSAPASAFGGLPQHMHPDAGATNSPQLSGPQGAPQTGGFSSYPSADPLRDVSTRVQPKATSEVKMSVRVLVESASAGRLIGKAGETVKKMREQSGAFIDIANSVRGATRRIVTVKGTPDPIAGALSLMAEALAGAEQDASKDHKSLFPGAAAGAGAKSEFQRPHPYQTGSAPGASRPRGAAPDEFADSEEHGPAHSLVLLVHNAQVGCIIGRGGATVRETREASGAIINVSENMLEGSMEKTVTVKGAPANVRKALTLIVHQLAERQDRSTNHNLYTPRPQFDGPHGAAGAPAHGPASMGAPSGMGVNPPPSGAPNYGSVQYQDNAAANNSGAYPAYLGYSMPVQQPAVAPAQPFSTVFPPSQPQAAPPAPTAMQQTVVVPVPDAMIGCVIGKRGQTVREIRQRSRATITIAELQPNQPDRMLTVTGTRQTIEIALALIYEKMHSFDPTKRGPPSAGAGGAPINGHAGPAAAYPKNDH